MVWSLLGTCCPDARNADRAAPGVRGQRPRHVEPRSRNSGLEPQTQARFLPAACQWAPKRGSTFDRFRAISTGPGHKAGVPRSPAMSPDLGARRAYTARPRAGL